MARKIGTIKTFLSLWMAHEKLYYSIFYDALEQLTITDTQRHDEDAISEALCPILKKICFESVLDVRTPDWEKPNQPSITEELKGGKIRKRPDFTCNFLNSFADCPEMYEIPFHVECKRLGKTVGSWNLNRNYVTNGIKRFDCHDHEYGKRAPSGMMLGYMVNMQQTAILDVVNKQLYSQLPELNFSFTQKVVSCEQKFIRKKVGPERFKLVHLWSDLKSS